MPLVHYYSHYFLLNVQALKICIVVLVLNILLMLSIDLSCVLFPKYSLLYVL